MANTKIKISSYDVGVKFLPETELTEIWESDCPEDAEDGFLPLGLCRFIKEGYQILIRDDLKGHLRRVAVNHEMVEAINNIYDLRLDHQTITTLAEAISQIESDNHKTLQALK